MAREQNGLKHSRHDVDPAALFRMPGVHLQHNTHCIHSFTLLTFAITLQPNSHDSPDILA